MKTKLLALLNRLIPVGMVGIASLLITPVPSQAADAVAHSSAAKVHRVKSSASGPTFNIQFDNTNGPDALFFNVDDARCIVTSAPHKFQVDPGKSQTYTLRTDNGSFGCRDVTKYVKWEVTPQTQSPTAPYSVKFIHGKNPQWGTVIQTDTIPAGVNAPKTATCNARNCLNNWVFENVNTDIIVGFK